MPGHRQRGAVAAKRHDALASALDAVHQLESLHAVVIVCARLDFHFLERRDLAIAGRPDDPDVGRAVVEHAHEVLGVLEILEAVGIGQPHAIPVVSETTRSPVKVPSPACDRGSILPCASPGRPTQSVRSSAWGRRRDGHACLRARRCRRRRSRCAQAVGERREVVRQVNARYLRRLEQRDCVIGRAPAGSLVPDFEARIGDASRRERMSPDGSNRFAVTFKSVPGLLHLSRAARRPALGRLRRHAARAATSGAHRPVVRLPGIHAVCLPAARPMAATSTRPKARASISWSTPGGRRHRSRPPAWRFGPARCCP